MKANIKREFTFCAAHRLLHHHGKCRNLHGHNYRVEVSVEAVIDEITGIALDFGGLKDVGRYIDENYDHACLIGSGDNTLAHFLNTEEVKLCPIMGETTAENIARELLDVVPHILGMDNGHRVVVRIWETENCSVELSCLS